jgi:hypothetical protein
MEAVHVEGPSGWTLYSLVADLRQRLVYVYFMFQYDAPLVFSIDHEIARPQPARPLSVLFPEETRQEADRAYQGLLTRSSCCDRVGLAWLGLVILSLAALLFLAKSRRRGMALWVPAVAMLGPVGLLAWLAAARGRRLRALEESAGDLPPNVAGMVVALLAAVLVPEIGQNPGLLLLVVYGLTLVPSLLFYQAPLLAWATGSGYLRTILRRMPAVLVSTNLALAGLVAVGLPLMNWQLGYCGLGRLVALQWWALAAPGAVLGGLLLYAYHAWAIRRGFSAWSAMLRGSDEGGDDTAAVCSPPWRRLWLWVVLSFVLLIAGIAAGVWGSAILSSVR